MSARQWQDDAGDTLTLDDMLMVREVSGARERTATFAPSATQREDIGAALLGLAPGELAQLRATSALLTEAAHVVLSARELRCGRCDKLRTYKRKGCLLVGKPNAWCDEHYAIDSVTWGCHPTRVAQRDDYQFPEVVALRKALTLTAPCAKESP